MMFSFPNLFQIVTAAIFTALGFLTFGEPLWFDRLFFAVLVVAGILHYKNINVIGVIAILLLARFADELGFWTLQNFSSWVKPIMYVIAAISLWCLRDAEEWFLFLAVTISLTLSIEIYWYFSDYKAPMVVWLIYLITVETLVRYALLIRIFITARFFPTKQKSIGLDHWLRVTAGIVIAVRLLELFEYQLRHLQVTTSTFFYTLAPYANHAITVTVLWMLLDQTARLTKERLIYT